MEPVFDRLGLAVAWRKRDTLHALDGRALGFIANRALFKLDGAFAGRFEDGLYRDLRNRIVAFESNATGGPLLPLPQPSPPAPMAELRPPQPVFAAVPPPGMRSMAWSDIPLPALFD